MAEQNRGRRTEKRHRVDLDKLTDLIENSPVVRRQRAEGRFYAGDDLSPQDSTILTRSGKIKQHGYKERLEAMKSENAFNLATNPTRADSLQYDRLHPDKKSIFSKPEEPDKRYPKQQFDDLFWTYRKRKADGTLTAAQEGWLERAEAMLEKGGSEDDLMGVLSQITKAEDIERKQEKTGRDIKDPETGMLMAEQVPAYTEPTRKVAGEIAGEAREKVFWTKQAKAAGMNPVQLQEQYKKGHGMAVQIAQAFRDGQLSNYNINKNNLPEFISAYLQRQGIEMTYEDILEFTQQIRQAKGN